jgi:hypothetical protein
MCSGWRGGWAWAYFLSCLAALEAELILATFVVLQKKSSAAQEASVRRTPYLGFRTKLKMNLKTI